MANQRFGSISYCMSNSDSDTTILYSSPIGGTEIIAGIDDDLGIDILPN